MVGGDGRRPIGRSLDHLTFLLSFYSPTVDESCYLLAVDPFDRADRFFRSTLIIMVPVLDTMHHAALKADFLPRRPLSPIPHRSLPKMSPRRRVRMLVCRPLLAPLQSVTL